MQKVQRQTDRKSMSFRVTKDGRELLKLLADTLGVSNSAVLEMALRDLAKQEGLALGPVLARAACAPHGAGA